jgi:hypothetical protein
MGGNWSLHPVPLLRIEGVGEIGVLKPPSSLYLNCTLFSFFSPKLTFTLEGPCRNDTAGYSCPKTFSSTGPEIKSHRSASLVAFDLCNCWAVRWIYSPALFPSRLNQAFFSVRSTATPTICFGWYGVARSTR